MDMTLSTKSEKVNRKTENESSVIRAIKFFYHYHNYGPSYRDIADATEIPLGTVYSTCQSLRDEGRITFEDNVARSIRIVE